MTENLGQRAVEASAKAEGTVIKAAKGRWGWIVGATALAAVGIGSIAHSGRSNNAETERRRRLRHGHDISNQASQMHRFL